MTDKKPKTTNALMKYLREEKNIEIHGANDKQKLLNVGYYHGYKGYRYFNKPTNRLPYNNFSELLAIYEFDNRLKTLFYPQVMFIETALKNRVLDEIVTETNSDDFAIIYHNLLDSYKSSSNNKNHSKKAEDTTFKRNLKKRLELRDHIYRMQTNAYNNDNKIATHYLSKDQSLPIWAIFELMTLGEFGTFVSCINQNCRVQISQSLNFRISDDTNGLLLQRFIYIIKDLRNAVAHNDVVFDTRFRTFDIASQVFNALEHETGISDITFDTITDYVILVTFLLKI